MHRPHLTASSFYYEHVGLSKIIGIFYDHWHIVIKLFIVKLVFVIYIMHIYFFLTSKLVGVIFSTPYIT